MKTIIVCDAIHPVGFELLKKEQDINVIDAVNTPKDKLLKILIQILIGKVLKIYQVQI